MDEVRKKSLVNSCTETVLEKLLAACLWSDRGHEAQEAVFLMVSCYALLLPGPRRAKSGRNDQAHDCFNLRARWNKYSDHLVFKESVWIKFSLRHLHWFSTSVGDPSVLRAKNFKSSWRIRSNRIILCFFVIIPSNIVHRHLPQALHSQDVA